MPKVRPLTRTQEMDDQLLAAIDKYKRLAGISAYGDLGRYIGGKSATTAVCRINKPGDFKLCELRALVDKLKIPPEELLPAIYGKAR